MNDVIDVVRRLAESGDGPSVAVVGSGSASAELAEQLIGPSGPGTSVVVVVSNDADEIRSAFEIVDDNGSVVLVCDDPPVAVELDVYEHVHARSLTVVGVTLRSQR